MTPEKKEYSEKDLDRLIEEASKHGAVHAMMYFDAHGVDSGAVSGSLVEFVSRLTAEQGVVYCKGEVLEPFKRPLETKEEGKTIDGYTTSASVRIVVDSFNKLTDLCLRYGPVGVEIMDPQRITLSLEEAQALLIDASQHSQEYTSYIMKSVLKGEELEKFNERVKQRAELGKKLMEGHKLQADGL